jgi:hypothetical protein
MTKPGVSTAEKYMTTLSQLQSRFKKALIAERLPSGPSCKGLGIRVTESFSLQERIHVYHADYFLRISESLAEDFPNLFEHWGELKFNRVVRGYLKEYPSRYPSLAQVGQDFPKYLWECKQFMHEPWLVQLAELEWTRCRALWTETLECVDFQKISELPQEVQAMQKLLLQPSLHFFEKSDGTHLAIFAIHGNLKELEISVGQEKLLRQIQTGESFGALTNWLGVQPELAPHAAKWFSEWVASGLLAGFQPA